MKRLVLGILLLLSVNVCHAESWEFIGTNTYGADIHLDKDSVVLTRKDYFDIWKYKVKTVHKGGYSIFVFLLNNDTKEYTPIYEERFTSDGLLQEQVRIEEIWSLLADTAWSKLNQRVMEIGKEGRK